jgi:hypothetical protein
LAQSDLRYGGLMLREQLWVTSPSGRIGSLPLQPAHEDYMAATRKSARRTTRKKRSGAKRTSVKKATVRKSTSKRRAKGGATRVPKKSSMKRTAKKGLRVAQEGLDTMREAGEKTWEVLKSTTAHVMGGVRDKLGEGADQK